MMTTVLEISLTTFLFFLFACKTVISLLFRVAKYIVCIANLKPDLCREAGERLRNGIQNLVFHKEVN